MNVSYFKILLSFFCLFCLKLLFGTIAWSFLLLNFEMSPEEIVESKRFLVLLLLYSCSFVSSTLSTTLSIKYLKLNTYKQNMIVFIIYLLVNALLLFTSLYINKLEVPYSGLSHLFTGIGIFVVLIIFKRISSKRASLEV